MALDPRHDARHIDYPDAYPLGTVVLVSGGTDSLINADAHPSAALLFVDLRHADSERELAACRDLFGGRLQVARVEAALGAAAAGVFLPARNVLLCSLAVHYGSDIVFGAMRDDHSVDKTPAALAGIARLLSEQSGRGIAVRAPLQLLFKHEAVARYVGTDAERGRRMLRTWSCYGPGPERCRDCKNCVRWYVAMRHAGLEVPRCSERAARWMLDRLHVLEPAERVATAEALA